MDGAVKKITISLDGSGVPLRIGAKQGDLNARFIQATLTDNGAQFSPPSGATAVLGAKRPDGLSKSFAATINQDGTVTAPLSGWVLESPGVVKCEISILQDGDQQQRLTTTTFLVQVEAAANTGEEISQDESYDILLGLITDTQTAKTAANKAASNAIKAETAAKSAATRANAAAEAAEGIVAQAGSLSFAINGEDGGLDITVFDKEASE